jgi:hypothetical protein
VPGRSRQTGAMGERHRPRTVDEITEEEIARRLASGRELVAALSSTASGDVRTAPLVEELRNALNRLAQNATVAAGGTEETERDAAIARARALLALSEVQSLIDAIARYVDD